MLLSISHNRKEESIEAKARWFQSLTLEERMELHGIARTSPCIVGQEFIYKICPCY